MAYPPEVFTPGGPPEPANSVFALPILIVDDQPADLEILADCLRDGGFENVRAAADGASGIGILAAADTVGEAPLVVVVAMRMPAPDGYEVLARIAAMEVGSRPLTLAVTGDSSPVARNAALQAGATDFITKPIDSVELLLRVRNLAEMKLQERELRRALNYERLAGEYRILANNSVDVIIHHRGREIVWVSPSVEGAFGWPRERWLGTEFLQHIHPDDVDTMSATLDEIAADRSVTARVRVAIEGGGYLWVEGRAKPYIDAAGNADGMIASVRVVDDQVEAERLRVEAERRYESLFEGAPDAMIIAGPDGRITLANAQSELLFGYTREELIGSEVDMLVPARLRGEHAAHRMGFFAEPGVRPMGVGRELCGLRRDGTEFPVAISLSPVRIGARGEVLAAIRDVTDRLEAERLRAEAERRYESLFEGAPDAMIIAGPDGRITLANAQSELLFGYTREELIGSEVDMLVPARLRGEHAAHRMGFFAEPGVRPMGVGRELCGLRRDGTEFPVAISLSPVRIGARGEVLAAIRDVTERREAEQRVTVERQRFEAVVKASPSAVSVTDLQHRYTMVNDAFCELFDQMSVAAVVGRTDRDVLPPEVWAAQHRAVARLLAGDDSPQEESMRRGFGSISVMTQRFALHDSVGAVAEVVTIRTDTTYRQKMLDEIAERSLWEERIGTAAGQLLVYSQPIVDIATRAMVDEELLVRLRVADAEEIMFPDQFLPQCERFDLMPVVDKYMVGHAIELARIGRCVSVNITGQTIADGQALGEIIQTLTDAGRQVTDKINFEITETTASAAPALSKAFTRSMRDLGCRVSLDDFGTGYGTFTELRHLHLHALKIDRSFVARILEDPEDERVVATIVAVARAYGLSTVAEGVESEAVLEKLAELGVERAQGYLFAKPTPVVS